MYYSISKEIILMIVDEFKGHQLIEAARSCDSAKIKKHINADTINFQHPLTMESALVSLLMYILHTKYLI